MLLEATVEQRFGSSEEDRPERLDLLSCWPEDACSDEEYGIEQQDRHWSTLRPAPREMASALVTIINLHEVLFVDNRQPSIDMHKVRIDELIGQGLWR